MKLTFTEAELYAAFRSALCEEDAREMARDAAEAIRDDRSISFNLDTLALLSFVSVESAQKVDALIDMMRDAGRSSEMDAAWAEAKMNMRMIRDSRQK